MKLKLFIKQFEENSCTESLRSGTERSGSCMESSISCPDEELYAYKLFHKEITLEPHILYIGCYWELLLRESPLPLNFLCILAAADEPHRGSCKKRYPNANFIFTVQKNPGPLIFEKAADIFLMENRYIYQVNRLTQAFISNRGLQFLIDEAYQICRSLIIVTDVSGQVLSMSQNALSDSACCVREYPPNDIIDYNLGRLKRDSIYERLRSSEEKLLCDRASDSKYRWLDMLVYAYEIEAAEISVMEDHHTFAYYDFKFFQSLTQAVSYEIQKRHSTSSHRRPMQSSFLAELLDQNCSSRHAAEFQKQPVDRKALPFLSILIIFPTGQKKNQNSFFQKAEFFSMQMQGLLPDSHWVIKEEHIVFLIFRENEKNDDFLPASPLSDILLRNKMYGILSRSFSEFSDVKKYYRQTLDVKEYKARFAPDVPISFYAEFSICHIGKIISKTYDLHDFCHPLVHEIQKYDETNHTNYLDTLEEYLTHIDNPSISAQNLCIHRNTFFYRINKLKELFPIDLKNGIERMKLLLTIEFMKLEN